MLKRLTCSLFGQKTASPILIEKVNSILLKPIGTAIGDSIVHLAHLRQLKEAFPKIWVGVLVTEHCKAIYEKSDIVDEILDDIPLTYINQRKKWDLYLDFLPSFTSRNIILEKVLSPKWVINFGKKDKKYYNLQTVKNYDETVYIPENTHFKNYLKQTSFSSYLKTDTIYELPEILIEKHFWQLDNQVRILLNPQGSTRALPPQELDLLLSQIKSPNTIFLMTNTKRSEEYFTQLTPRENLHLAPKMGLFEYFSLIQNSDIVVAVDGGGVHIACAYKKPLLSFYANNKYNIHKWAPSPYDGVNIMTSIAKEPSNNDATFDFNMIEAANWLNKQIEICQKNKDVS